MSKLKIYTSYYGNIKKVISSDLRPLGITLFPPRWLTQVANYELLAPTKQIFYGNPDRYEYLFKNHLKMIPAKKVIQDLKEWSAKKPVCLLCYEKPGEFCHRHLVAEWLREYGVEVEEFDHKVESEKLDKPDQLSLF